MKRFCLILGLISIVGLRYYQAKAKEIPVGTRVRITIPTVDFPEYSEKVTVIRRGEWTLTSPGYTKIMPGEVVRGEGNLEQKGKVCVKELTIVKAQSISLLDKAIIGISYLRAWSVTRLQRGLPEPQASLAAGILLGIKARMPNDFYQALVNTGTLHIVAASGYNVMVVANLLMTVLIGVVGRQGATVGGVVGILIYVILSGASPSVVRAGIMGSLTLIGQALGRQTRAKWLLLVTGSVMLIAQPRLLVDVGFQLSVAATLGLLYICEPIKNGLGRITALPDRVGALLGEYLYPSLAATIATTPIIFWHFGRVGLMGVVTNLLVLPLIPVIMLLSGITLLLPIAGNVLYVALWWVVTVIRRLG